VLTESSAKLTSNPAHGSAAVVVVGDDAIVGKALELLLRSAEYDVVFLTEPLWEIPGSLDGTQLLVFAPPLSAHKRQAILVSMERDLAERSVPVLDLVAGASASQLGERHFVVPWPCHAEELRRHMEAALRAGYEPGRLPLRQSRERNG
jgi:hypothetical protein